ncbi:NAD(P)-binding protein [Aureobasidium subglaciale]|nr:NAD(P)-binding protein [Aureobasidium subglaciale]KAI5213751.1 NAD(P)-binding protein [Aureobasidium subglaciale]KAI5215628.1 NAD(P)-binding protein [Aureobasidium subglaciale]KAI5253665.1 NAD(P)-binding protein [Aureobasidium subglaciale]
MWGAKLSQQQPLPKQLFYTALKQCIAVVRNTGFRPKPAPAIFGGSVIKHLLADSTIMQSFKLRGITRDISKPSAKALAAKGVELKSADLNDEASVAQAIKGSHTVFLVTNYWETANPATEIAQGKNVANVAKKEGISHLIFSSLLNVTKTSKGKLAHVPHFDGKAEIEEYIKETGVPCSFILPGYFMSNLSQMLQKGEDGSLTWALPISDDAKFPLFDTAEDTGKFVKAAIKSQSPPSGKQILCATDYYTPKQILSEIEEVTGKKTNFYKISSEQYKSYLPEFMAEEMLENHLFIEEPGYFNGASLDESLGLLEEAPVTWKEFVKKSGDFN